MQEFQGRMKAKYPFFSGVIERNYEQFGDDWATELAQNIVTMFGPPAEEGWNEAVRGYALFSLDALRSQKFFETNGRYAASNHSEVKRDYWDNPEFMLVNYLPGMFLSYYLWPHHFRLLRFYRDEVLPLVAARQPQTFCEVGTGTSVYSRETLRGLPDIRGTGYDISAHALSFGSRVLSAFGCAERFRFEQRDILANSPGQSDYLICQEVLEHLEDPQTFTRGLRSMVADGGLAYITAAVTAGHSDHIYLFESPAEARAVIEDAGFSVLLERTEEAESANVRETAPRVSCYLCEPS